MLFTEDALYYAEGVKNRDFSIIDLTIRAIENIEQTHDQINAVVHLQKDQALDTAEKLHAQLSTMSQADRNQLPKFYGVPNLLKDLTNNQTGQPVTAGSKLFKDNIAQQTDTFVQRLIDEGFVIIGRTNISEFGLKFYSDSTFYGPVNSPLDLARNPGGSSGGAGAALLAGLVPIAVGSDGGGSIRIPASYSGLIGLKPSRGRTVVGPVRFRGWQGAASDFALTKSTRDTLAFLQATQNDEVRAPFLVPPIQNQTIEDLNRPLKIAYVMDSTIQPLTETTKDSLSHTVKTLQDLGHDLVQVDFLIDNFEAMKNYLKLNGVETASMLQSFQKRTNRKIEKADIEPLSYAVGLYGLKIPAFEYSQALNQWDAWSDQLEQFFKDYDLLLTPTTNGPAPRHTDLVDSKEDHEHFLQCDQMNRDKQEKLLTDYYRKLTGRAPYPFVFNLTGQPAISLPLYQDEDGLPIGSQFTSPKGQDYLLLQLAKQLEDEGKLNIQIHPIQ